MADDATGQRPAGRAAPTSAEVEGLYQDIILDHYRRPRNKSALDDPARRVHHHNPLCGDEIELAVRVDDSGTVSAAKYISRGCSISQASASMMTVMVTGRATADALALSQRVRQMLRGEIDVAGDRSLGDVRALAGVARFPARVRCAALAWGALEEALSVTPDDAR